MRKVILYLVAALIFSTELHAQAMTVGGLAFTGYNRDDWTGGGPTPLASDDEFSFVLLQALGANQPIFFTDFGWRSDVAAFQSGNPCGASTGAISDGVIRWQHTAVLPRGTHVRIRCRFTLTATIGTVTPIVQNLQAGTEYLNLSPASEQIFAFTGSVAAPTLIAGIDISDAWEATLANCDFTSTASTLPAALSTNNYAFRFGPELGKDNGRLKETVKLTNPANAATDRANIANIANWDFSDLSNFTLPGNLFILPVEFTHIKAYQKGANVDVEWAVGTEANVMKYVVERSADGRLFSEVGTVTASSKRSYAWSDIKPIEGNNFYRIRAVDVDATAKLSTIALVNLGKAGKGINVYPTIVRDRQFSLQITNMPAGNYRFDMFNAVGQRVYTKNVSHLGGSATQSVNIPAGLPKGTYRIRMLTEADNSISIIVIE